MAQVIWLPLGISVLFLYSATVGIPILSRLCQSGEGKFQCYQRYVKEKDGKNNRGG